MGEVTQTHLHEFPQCVDEHHVTAQTTSRTGYKNAVSNLQNETYKKNSIKGNDGKKPFPIHTLCTCCGVPLSLHVGLQRVQAPVDLASSRDSAIQSRYAGQRVSTASPVPAVAARKALGLSWNSVELETPQSLPKDVIRMRTFKHDEKRTSMNSRNVSTKIVRPCKRFVTLVASVWPQFCKLTANNTKCNALNWNLHAVYAFAYKAKQSTARRTRINATFSNSFIYTLNINQCPYWRSAQNKTYMTADMELE